MSRSKNKIAVTTLLSALACSATASAAGQNGKDIRSVESQTSFSTRKSSESSIKSARSLEGARSWFQKIPTWAKITALVSAPIVAAEIYNEIAGAVSGKKWYSGKYSFVNLARGKGEDENPESNENSSTVENSGNQDETDNNIDDKSKVNTNAGLGAAPSSLTKEQEEQLNTVLKAFEGAANEVPGLYKKFEEKLKDGLIRIIKGKFKIVADEANANYAEKFINFVKGENGDCKVGILKSNYIFVIKVSGNKLANNLAKRFAVSIVNDKLKIGDNLILLD